MDGSRAPVYRQEDYAKVIAEIGPLLTKHHREIALYQDRIPLDPDFTFYVAMGQQRRMRIFTVRVSEQLCGYAIYFVKPHPHYKGHTWAVSDIFWLDQEKRGLGLGDGLFGFVERSLKAEGVAVMHTTSKAAHPAARALLERRGHELIEFGHSICLLEP